MNWLTDLSWVVVATIYTRRTDGTAVVTHMVRPA